MDLLYNLQPSVTSSSPPHFSLSLSLPASNLPNSPLHLVEELPQRPIDLLPPLQLHPVGRIEHPDAQIRRPGPHARLLQPRHRDVVVRARDEQGRFRDVAVSRGDGGVVGEVDVGEHGFVPAWGGVGSVMGGEGEGAGGGTYLSGGPKEPPWLGEKKLE